MKKLLLCLGLAFSLFSKPTIVFDYGGVLVHHHYPGGYECIQNQLNVSRDIAEQLYVCICEASVQNKDAYEAIHQFTKANGLQDINRQDFEALYQKIFVLDPQTRSIVHRLQAAGYETAMLSNISTQNAEFVKQMGHYEDFTQRVLSCDIGVDKPYPRIYQALISKLKVQPEEIIFIDDLESNLLAAQNLGIQTIHFKGCQDLLQRLSDHGIDLD